MRLLSKTGTLAIKQPTFVKPETQMKGGLALISQRTETIVADLVMDYKYGDHFLEAGRERVILRGEAGLTAWAKKIFSLDGTEYVLCPESEVIGFVIKGILE